MRNCSNAKSNVKEQLKKNNQNKSYQVIWKLLQKNQTSLNLLS